VSVRYLTLDEVFALHAQTISTFGGSIGVRSQHLLDSALGIPAATYDGEDLHPSLTEKAGAYAFHLIKNHPFVDGNKRVGIFVALVFLDLNEFTVEATEDELVDLGLGLADGRVRKAGATVFFDQHTQKSR
jgi:death-on-curing protein